MKTQHRTRYAAHARYFLRSNVCRMTTYTFKPLYGQDLLLAQ